MTEATANDEVEILVGPEQLPSWYHPLVNGIAAAPRDELVRFRPPPDEPVRHSAVLVLFGDRSLTGDGGAAAVAGQPDRVFPGTADPADAGPDVLIIKRAADMRSHAGQPAFPGGAHDPGDDGPIGTALREAQEETLLNPAGVTPVATLPRMWLPPSGFVVTPVLGWWHEPSPVLPGDPAEVAEVARIPVADMINPANRVKVSHPSGYVGSGFEVNDMLVWGFTGLLLDRLFALAGWEQPWQDGARVVPFDDGWRLPKNNTIRA